MVPNFVATFVTLAVSIIALFFRLMGKKYDYIETDLLNIQRYTSSVSCIVAGDYSNLEENSHEEFLENFQSLVDRVEDYLSSPFVDKPYHVYITLSRARDALNRVNLTLRKNFIRKQPFGIIFGGPPGSGKTFGLQRLCCELYKLDHEKCNMDDIVILNEGDQFQSEFQSHHKIVIFDDLGATNVNVIAQDPFRKVIDFINNVPKTALNPHLDLKGIVWIQPDIVGATTNMKLPLMRRQQANTDSIHCPGALNRRFKLKIWQKGFDEFYIVPDGVEPQYDDEWNASFESKSNRLNYDQLFKIAKELYLEHNQEQEDFLALTETLHAESAALEFMSIVAFQQALRVFIGKIGFTNWLYSSLMVLGRRFVAIPLNTIKSEVRSNLIASLYRAGVSSAEMVSLVQKMEYITRISTSTSFLVFTKDERDLIATIVAITLRTCLRFVGNDIFYDLLYVICPYIIGNIYDTFSGVQDPDAPETHWPLSSFVGRKLFSMKEKLLHYLPSRLKTESKLTYVTKILDVQFVEACLEELNLTMDSEFKLEIFEDSIIIDSGGSCQAFSKKYTRDCSNIRGIIISKDQFLKIREQYYKSNPVKAESVTKYSPEFKYSRTKKNLSFWPRQFRAVNAEEIVQDFLIDKCSIPKFLTALGGEENAYANFVPNFALTLDYEFVRGRMSIFYIKQTKRMFFILREKDKQISLPDEFLLNLFKNKCSMYAILCPQKGVKRYMLPLLHSEPIALQQDLTTMHRHFDVQNVLYGGAFVKGTLFRFETFFGKVEDKSIRIENLESFEDSEDEDSLEYSWDEEDCETVTSKGCEDPLLVDLH